MIAAFRTFVLGLMLFSLTACSIDVTTMALRDEEGDECETVQDAIQVDTDERVLVPIDPEQPDGVKVGVISWILYQIRSQLGGVVENIYRAFAENAGWKYSVGAATTMVILFYVMAVTIGAVNSNWYVLFMTIIKILFVWQLATNGDFFGVYIYNLIEINIVQGISEGLASMFSANDYVFLGDASQTSVDTANVASYTVADNIISMIFSLGYFKILAASAASGVNGWAYSILIAASLTGYITLISRAVFVYLIAFVARSLLYIVAPLYMAFLLFPQTRSLFDNWFRLITNYTLKPIFLFAFLGLFHAMMSGLIQFVWIDAQDKEICYREVYRIGSAKLNFWQIGEDDSAAGSVDDMVELLPLISISILLMVMYSTVSWAERVSAIISTGISTNTSVGGISGSAGMQRRVEQNAATLTGGERKGPAERSRGRGARERGSMRPPSIPDV